MKKLSKSLKSAVWLGILMLLGALIGQPTANGYLHAGDIFVLLGAVFLPAPHAMAAAGISGVLADLLTGYQALAPITLINKLLMILLAKALLKTSFGKEHPEFAAFPSAFIPVAGYYLHKLILLLSQGGGIASFGAAAGTLQKDLIQAAAGFILFIFFYDMYMGFRAAKAAAKKVKEEEDALKQDDSQIME